jgi:feruloyl esterase
MRRIPSASLVFLGVSAAPLFAQQTCQGLTTSLALEHATITSATAVPEGPVAGGGRGGAAPVVAVAHCAVQGIIRPTKDSEIHFELWLPASGWNGKYVQLGSGGWAGTINAAGLAEPLRRGYAAAATDDGHQGGAGATWAIGHPEKLIDFGYRAVHETSLQSKAIIRAFWGRGPSRSYFNGCSDGGREALMEAQRSPEEFDGIIAGAPFHWFRLERASVDRDAGQRNPAREAAPYSECSYGRVRHSGRLERRTAGESARLPLRPLGFNLQGRGRSRMPHSAAGGNS